MLLLMLGMGACSVSPSPVPSTGNSLREELVRRVPEEEPEWTVLGSREEDEEHFFFVGYSKKRREERDALAEARSDAGNRFVEYCGIEARVFNEYLSVSFALSSQVRDATESRRSGSRQRAEAYFSRLKLVERSAVLFRELRGEAEVGRFYRVKVLARVPKSEYERVREWKKEHDKRRMEIAENVLEKQLTSAQTLADDGSLLASLEQLRLAREAAAEEQTPRWRLYLARAKEMQAFLLAGLNLVSASLPLQQIEPGKAPQPLAVRVQLRGRDGRQRPVPHFPVVFYNAGARMSVRSGPDGRAVFQLPPRNEEGILELQARADVELLDKLLPPESLAALKGRPLPFRIEVTTPFLKKQVMPDFQLLLNSTPARESLHVGIPVSFTVRCERRCHARLYAWDGRFGVLLAYTGSRRLLRKKPVQLARITPEAAGRYTFIALAAAGRFPDFDAPGTKYSLDEFRVLLKNFRDSDGPKSETQVEINVLP